MPFDTQRSKHEFTMARKRRFETAAQAVSTRKAVLLTMALGPKNNNAFGFHHGDMKRRYSTTRKAPCTKQPLRSYGTSMLNESGRKALLTFTMALRHDGTRRFHHGASVRRYEHVIDSLHRVRSVTTTKQCSITRSRPLLKARIPLQTTLRIGGTSRINSNNNAFSPWRFNESALGTKQRCFTMALRHEATIEKKGSQKSN